MVSRSIILSFHYADSYTQLFFLADNQVMIQSLKTDAPSYYLTFENRRFTGSQGKNDDNVFEMVPVGDYSIALRVISDYEAGKSHGVDSECYLGFSDEESEPRCYESTDYAATRLKIFQ